MMSFTFGRRPRYREVKSYYHRDDVLAYLFDASRVRRVMLSFRAEPSIHNEENTPPLAAECVEDLKKFLEQRFDEMLPMERHPDDQPLNAYPSFHFLTKPMEDEPWDFVLEADCPGWRHSFVDVRGPIEILRRYEVPFLIKFSGHRSLHLIIPREAFPREYRGQPIGKAWKGLDSALRSFFAKKAVVRRAHGTGGLLRLAYSLNENTGLVSCPVHAEALGGFRPWEAFHPLVQVDPTFWLTEVTERCQAGVHHTEAFLHDALQDKSIKALPGKIWSFDVVPKTAYVAAFATTPSSRTEEICRDMARGVSATDEAIQGYHEESEPDVRWLIAESLLGDPRAFGLLPETDAYALCAIEDSIAFQAEQSVDAFLGKFLSLSDPQSQRQWYSVLERLDPEPLRKELLAQLNREQAHDFVRCASMFGFSSRDWSLVEELIREVKQRYPGLLGGIEQNVLDAVRRLGSFDREEVRVAQQTLVEAGPVAIEPLVLSMGAEDTWVRKHAMQVLRRLDGPEVAECLVSALGDPNRKVRSMAVAAMVRRQDQEGVRELLQEAANTDDPILRSNAVRLLAVIDDEAALSLALQALESTNTRVRGSAIKSLARLDHPGARQGLRQALWDVVPELGVSAAQRLAEQDDEGLTILQSALQEAEAAGETQAAQCIAHGLAELGDASGLGHLIAALYQESWEVWSTADTIAELDQPSGNDVLLDYYRQVLLTRDPQNATWRLARTTLRLFRKVQDARVLPMVQDILAAIGDKKLRRSCVKLLTERVTELGDSDAHQMLVELEAGSEHHLAQLARNALERLLSSTHT